MSDGQSSNDSNDKSWIEKITRVFSAEPKNRKELMAVLAAAKDNKLIDTEALDIIDGALQVSEQQAREVMVPRPQMIVVKSSDISEEFLPKIIESGHSRFPVIGETSDEVQGILLAKDLLPYILTPSLKNLDLQNIIRPVVFVPESKRLNILLKEFRENRNHMAVVIDEYGGVSGLITLEDILEEIVGEIEDETDEETATFIKKVADNDFIVQALTPIDDFNTYFKCELDNSEVETFGGLIMRSFGYLPKRNEITQINQFNIRVLNADHRQVHLLRLTKLDDV